MTDNDEFRDWPEGAGVDFGDGRPPRQYDPLFHTWDDAPYDPGEPGAGVAYLPSAHASPQQDAYSLAWDLPLHPSPSLPPGEGRPTSWYATRWHEAYLPQLTEAQRRLRAGVVTIPHPARRWTVTVRELAETLLLALLIFLSVRASFQNFRVEGASMQPSLENGEYLIVNKLSYATLDLSIFNFLPFFDAGDNPVRHLWGEPSRGDVIVFRAPTNPDRDFIKRIIGLPGDTIEINGQGQVILNGAILDEPYIAGTTNCNAQCEKITIPEAGSPQSRARCGSDACYFVMGDNRQNSSDSRQGWLVPEENIIGKAVVTYWHDGGPEFDLAPNHSVAANEPGN